MAVIDQVISDKFAVYNGDCVEVMQGIPDNAIHLSIYSPPFAGLYHYSSSERDMSNCDSYETFMHHYGFVVKELNRITMPGRVTCVHCMDVPRSNSGTDSYVDFPGDIIRLHEANGWRFTGRRMIWNEPLAVRLRTMQKNLAHASLVADSIDCGVAAGDQLLTFRKIGENPVPVAHPVGMLEYAACLFKKARGYPDRPRRERPARTLQPMVRVVQPCGDVEGRAHAAFSTGETATIRNGRCLPSSSVMVT